MTITRKTRKPLARKSTAFAALVLVVLGIGLQQRLKHQPSLWEVFMPANIVGLPATEIELEKWEVIDLRTTAEFEVSHLAGSHHFPSERILAGEFPTLHTSKPILVYCTIGWRSQLAGIKLQKSVKHPVFHIQGGLFGWLKAGKPLHLKEGTPTRQVHPYGAFWEWFLGYGTPVYAHANE